MTKNPDTSGRLIEWGPAHLRDETFLPEPEPESVDRPDDN